MEFQLSYFKSWKMMLWKCCTQYASKFGKLSSSHRTGKGQFSFQSQRKTMPKNAHAAAKSLQSCESLCKRQPTRLPHPWDSPGKNTGVGCHFLLQCMKVKSESEVAQSYPTLSDPKDCSLPGFSVHGIFQARILEWGAIVTTIAQSNPPLSAYPWEVFWS